MFIILTRFKLRARTSALSSFTLANYSEFGLIVGAAGVASGWISAEWLVIFAVSLSLSMIMASPLNMQAQSIYAKLQNYFLRFETENRLSEDEPIVFGKEEVIVFGMGRTGSEVYKVMQEKYKKNVLGIDINLDVIEKKNRLGYHVIHGDVTDLNFWQRISMSANLPLIILVTPSHATHMTVISQLQEIHCNIKVNLYEEAGFGFANHTYNQIFGKL